MYGRYMNDMVKVYTATVLDHVTTNGMFWVA